MHCQSCQCWCVMCDSAFDYDQQCFMRDVIWLHRDYVDVNSVHPLHPSWNIADHSQMHRYTLHTNIDMTATMPYTWGLLCTQIVFHFLMTVTWTNMTEEYHCICCIAHVTLLIIIKYEWLGYTPPLTSWWPAMPYTWGLLCTQFVTRHININSNQDYVEKSSMHPLHLSWNIADHSKMPRHIYTPTLTWLAMPYTWGLLCTQFVTRHNINSNQDYVDVNSMQPYYISHETLLIIVKCTVTHYTPTLTWLAMH